MTPTRSASFCENQTLPSGPSAMPSGPQSRCGSSNSVMAPSGVMRPILPAARSVNQRLPSAPSMMPIGRASLVGSGNSAKAPLAGSKQPILLLPLSQNQSCPPPLGAMM